MTDDRKVDAESADLLRDTNRPTAVLLYSEREVSALMCVASELGLSVPRDLSVAVFTAGELFAGGKTISSMQVPTREMGRRAVAMLMQKLDKPNEPCAPQVVTSRKPIMAPASMRRYTISQNLNLG